MFVILVIIALFVSFVIDALIFLGSGNSEYGQATPPFLVTILACLALTIPWISVMVRRLHDINRSGWWYLINFLPILGGVILLVFTVQAGDPRKNRFGLPPKETPRRLDEGHRESPDLSRQDSNDRWMYKLEQLAKLRDQGILTEEEFGTEKAALIARNS